MPLLASTASTIAFSFGMALISFFLIRHSRRYYSRSKNASDPPGPLAGSTTDRPAIGTPPESHELVAWEVHMHETARDLMGQLDAKMRALQALIRLADESSARLEQSLRRVRDSGHFPDEPH